MYYNIPRKETRITLFSSDADIEHTGHQGRPRTYNWNIKKNLGTYSDNCKIAVESIFCRNVRAIVKATTTVQDAVYTFSRISRGNAGSNYRNNSILKTQANTGTGQGLTIQNIHTGNTVNDILGANPHLIARGFGYAVGDIVDVLDSDDTLPIGGSLAQLRIETLAYDDVVIPNHDFIVSDLDAVDTGVIPDDTFINQQRMLAVGNQDEKELYSVRCPHVNGNYDSRAFGGGDIIYMGAMKMNNTNPDKAFCYDLKDKSFLNGGVFTLSIDSNYIGESGISHDMIWGITLKVFDYDDNDNIDGNVPKVNKNLGSINRNKYV